jgi:hypothetical protein
MDADGRACLDDGRHCDVERYLARTFAHRQHLDE